MILVPFCRVGVGVKVGSRAVVSRHCRMKNSDAKQSNMCVPFL